MPNFVWTEELYSVHVPEIDAEHQAIFRLCREFQAVTRSGANAQVRASLNELAIYSLEHFWHEERQMRAADYPFYSWHRQQHHTARKRIRELQEPIRRGDREAARELLAFLRDWLHDHIRLTDRMLGAHLRNRRRELSASANE